MLRVGVIGAGISGLSFSYYLKTICEQHAIPLDLRIFETSEYAGGRLKSENVEGVVVEYGPDSIFTNIPDAYELALKLGLRDQLIFPRGSGFGFVSNGTVSAAPTGLLLPFPQNIPSILKLKSIPLSARVRALLGGLFLSTPHEQDIDLASLYRRRFGAVFSMNALEPLLSGVYGTSAEELGAEFLQPLAWQGSSVGIQQIFKSSRSKKNKLAPYFSFRNGLSCFTETLTNYFSKKELLTGTEIQKILPAGSKGSYSIKSKKEIFECDHVVCTTPVQSYSSLFDSYAIPSSLSKYTYESTGIVNLLIQSESVLKSNDLSGYIFSKATQDMNILSPSAISFMSDKWPDRQKENIYSVRIFYRNPKLGLFSESEILSEAFKLVQSLADRASKLHLVYSHLQHWEQASPVYGVGYAEAVRQFDSYNKKVLPNIRFLGPVRSSGIPSCVKAAKILANEIIAHQA